MGALTGSGSPSEFERKRDEYETITNEFDAAEVNCVRAQDRMLKARNPISRFIAKTQLSIAQADLQRIQEEGDVYEIRSRNAS